MGFLGELKTPKGHFEINWPLEKTGFKCLVDLRGQDTYVQFGNNFASFQVSTQKYERGYQQILPILKNSQGNEIVLNGSIKGQAKSK